MNLKEIQLVAVPCDKKDARYYKYNSLLLPESEYIAAGKPFSYIPIQLYGVCDDERRTESILLPK